MLVIAQLHNWVLLEVFYWATQWACAIDYPSENVIPTQIPSGEELSLRAPNDHVDTALIPKVIRLALCNSWRSRCYKAKATHTGTILSHFLRLHMDVQYYGHNHADDRQAGKKTRTLARGKLRWWYSGTDAKIADTKLSNSLKRTSSARTLRTATTPPKILQPQQGLFSAVIIST